MQTQYNWIVDQIAQGKTVLAYDRSAPRGKVYRLNAKSDRMFWFDGNDVWVDGRNARGWTFALKPEGKK